MRIAIAHRRQRHPGGFTLIELLVVMAAIGLLLSLVLPRYFEALDRGKEKVLQHNLAAMREALDKYYGDNGKYPDRLEDLVARRYLRSIPVDPFTEKATWVVVAPKEPSRGGVIDVRSTGADSQGQPRQPAQGAALGAADDAGFAAQDGDTQTVTVEPLSGLPPQERMP